MYSKQWDLLWDDINYDSQLNIPEISLLTSFTDILEKSLYSRSSLLNILKNNDSHIDFMDFLKSLALETNEIWHTWTKLLDIFSILISWDNNFDCFTNQDDAKKFYHTLVDWKLLDCLSDNFFLWLRWFSSKTDINKTKAILMETLIVLSETAYKYMWDQDIDIVNSSVVNFLD